MNGVMTCSCPGVAYGGCLQLQRCNHEDCCDVFCCVMAVEMDFLICLCFMVQDFFVVIASDFARWIIQLNSDTQEQGCLVFLVVAVLHVGK